MLHWIANSRSGFVALLMAAFIVAVAIYALPALMAWSMGSPQRVPSPCWMIRWRITLARDKSVSAQRRSSAANSWA